LGLNVLIELPDEIYAGTTIPIRVVVSNRKRFMPSFLIKMKVGDSETIFPIVDKTGLASGLATISFPARGRHAIRDIYISSAFPFNFFVRFRRLDTEMEIIVFPALKKCSIASLFGRDEKSRGEITLDRSGFEADMLSIREYRYGDPQKYIHWKASARTGKLKTKELSSLAERPVVLDLDKIAMTDLEEKISCVTYTIVNSFRLNVPVGLKIGEKLFNSAPMNPSGTKMQEYGKIAMLKALALYGRKP